MLFIFFGVSLDIIFSLIMEYGKNENQMEPSNHQGNVRFCLPCLCVCLEEDVIANVWSEISRLTVHPPGTGIIRCSESAAWLYGLLCLCHFSSIQLDWMYPKNNLQPRFPLQKQVTKSSQSVEWV